MRRRVTLACCALLASAPGAAADSVKAGPYRAHPRFTVTYRGTGRWHTTYHSEPPNPGGMHDTNDAHDSSRQRWSLRFDAPIGLRTATVTGASGSERASGRIDHTHIDGLFAADDQAAHCSVRAATPENARLSPVLQLRASAAAFRVRALDPVALALTLLPSACPGQGDSLDGVLDNYYTPGFSFASSWGADRWFTSAEVAIPSRIAHRARRIEIRLHAVRAGTPPAGCAVLHPTYERCTTGGSWSGVLTLTRRGRSAG